ncbi:polysaccharide pyruvyl transferase family protein [Flavobacterium sp. FlaQc-50]|uniref:polysaccharide pyruvyl transferase family protein n=1 Tax=unclassified Flavobacterium TaxID=196869 RepID=UPI0037581A6E
MKINIRGAYGETNFGDDLLMCVFENYFLKEFDNVQLNFVGDENGYVDKLLIDSTYLEPDFLPDWEVYGGGTQFFAFQNKYETSLWQKINIVLKNPGLIKRKLKNVFGKTTLNNSKIAFIGFGIGPFYENQEAISNAKEKILEADFVGVRDEVSSQYCADWNIPATLGADVVFSSYFMKIDLKKAIDTRPKKKIGIIVRDWEWEESGRNYIDNLIKFSKSYSDVEMQFIVFAPSKDKGWLAKLKNENALIWDPQKYSINLFLEELNTFDGFISARYHGAIIAALLQKPVICVEIEPKLKILTEQVKEIKLWQKPFDIEELVKLVNQLNYDVDYANSLEERKIKADHMLLEFKKRYNELY